MADCKYPGKNLNYLSFIIVTYNSAETIGQCLQSLIRSVGTQQRYEIYVVDNNSQDTTAAIVEKEFPSAVLIRNDRNEGFAAAANKGARRAAGDLFFLNPDTVIPDNITQTIGQICDRFQTCGILGFQFADIHGKPQPSVWRLPSISTLLAESLLPYQLALPLITVSPSRTTRTDMVSGGCMFVRRDLFLSLGGFDPDFFLYYEDADLCHRAAKMGQEIIYSPSVIIAHHGRNSFHGDYDRFFQEFYAGKLRYCSKHFMPFRYSLARMIVFLGIRLKIIAYRIAAAMSGKTEMSTLARAHSSAYRRIRGV